MYNPQTNISKNHHASISQGFVWHYGLMADAEQAAAPNFR
jgi:hypothetical protein